MIRYRISRADLEARIDAESPGWLRDAAERTARFRDARQYDESSSNWGAVKIVYMRLQGDCKCAYCERKLEAEEYGKAEQDVEHFRPKKNVRPWKLPASLSKLGLELTEPPDGSGGYYLLPYHPFNYAAACKPCNSALKKDYFPIRGQYMLDADDPARMKAEKPLLLYPVGTVDDDPESVIRFHGVVPQPCASRGYARQRALVTIEFFKLDDVTGRKHLFRERAMIIIAMFPQLENIATAAAGDDVQVAQAIVDGFTSPSAPHTNCARSFAALYSGDRAAAKAVFEHAAAFIGSTS